MHEYIEIERTWIVRDEQIEKESKEDEGNSLDIFRKQRMCVCVCVCLFVC